MSFSLGVKRFFLVMQIHAEHSYMLQYLVAQIKKAIVDVESGNTVSYATGKVWLSSCCFFIVNINEHILLFSRSFLFVMNACLSCSLFPLGPVLCFCAWSFIFFIFLLE